MAKLNILVSGASIGGPVLAYWLAKAGNTVTVIEKDSQLRTNGQSVDIRDGAVTIVRKMGLLPAVEAKTTKEAGVAFVDQQGKPRATFAASGNAEVQSFTSEFEIFRGDLAQIFYDASSQLPGVTYIFGDHITGLEQDTSPDATDKSVLIQFASGRDSQRYDIVVGADGLGSKTRGLAFNTSTREHIWPLDLYATYFTMDEDLLDGSNIGRWYNAPGGRCIFLRPDPQRRTRANLMLINHGDTAQNEQFKTAFRTGMTAVKPLFAETFKDAGWVATKVIAGMQASTDFYGQEVAQIRMDGIVKGRVTLVGDAGYCPTPLTGFGTSLALIGAYILAGEIFSHEHVDEALAAYERIMLPYAKSVQGIPYAMPRIANPKTAWGIKIQLGVLGWVTYLGIDRFGMWVGSWKIFEGKKFQLPEYQWPGMEKTVET